MDGETTEEQINSQKQNRKKMRTMEEWSECDCECNCL